MFDLGTTPLDLAITAVMTLVGFGLILPATLLARELKRFFAAAQNGTARASRWIRLAIVLVPTLMVLAGLAVVGHVRYKSGEATISELHLVLFTALGTFGAFTVEYMAFNPYRHALDRLETMR